MTMHDTWVGLKDECPLRSIINYFPNNSLPMRDPFPMLINEDGTTSWVIDLERMTAMQVGILAQAIAEIKKMSVEQITEMQVNHGFAIKSHWIKMIECGDEGYIRINELVDFLSVSPNITRESLRTFFNLHQERWITDSPPISKYDHKYLTIEMSRAIETLINFGHKKFLVETNRAITIREDGGLSVVEFERPSDWGDTEKWHFEFFRFEWQQINRTIVHNCYCWTNNPNKELYPTLFCKYIADTNIPDMPPELCANTHLDVGDIWLPEWGEQPPFYAPEILNQCN